MTTQHQQDGHPHKLLSCVKPTTPAGRIHQKGRRPNPLTRYQSRRPKFLQKSVCKTPQHSHGHCYLKNQKPHPNTVVQNYRS